MAETQIMGYTPGAIGRIAEIHAEYYSKAWGFGKFFEIKVATQLCEFLSRFDDRRDGFWTILREHRVEGSIAIDGVKGISEGAHLRWFIVSSALRGQGFGNRLLAEAIAFCKSRHFSRVHLFTFEGLEAARHLYEKFGFQLVREAEGTSWGTRVNEQEFVLELA